jgi:coenzyme PQQ synthesis protein D (PqqD)
MFEWLKKFRKILVTGPQRSGTRICAKMIARDTGYKFIDEKAFGADSIYRLFHVIQRNEHCVIQGPGLCRYVHMFEGEDTCIVLMRRNIKDIVASQERIGWTWERAELMRYDRPDCVIARVKYDFWEKYQKALIRHAFEVEYESLAGHPLWVPKKQRLNFRADQTERLPDDPVINKNAYLCPHPDILYFECPDNNLSILLKNGKKARLLNYSGGLIWRFCDGARTFMDVMEELKKQFQEVDGESLERDLVEFIKEMVSMDFLFLSSNKKDSPSGKS